jgi:uncharacterized protein (TIGR02001 family)
MVFRHPNERFSDLLLWSFTPGNSLRFAFTFLASLAFLVSSARADEFSAVVSVSSNYFYRGYSKSANDVTARGNVEYQPRSWFYVGSWISRVDFDDQGFDDRSNVEFYPYVGVNFKLNDSWRLESSISRYVYDGQLFGKDSDYNEYSAAVHFSDLITARLAVADDLYHRGDAAIDYELTGRYPITEKLEASAGLGYNDAKPVLEYNTLYWNIGLTWFFKYGALDFRYVDAAHSSLSYGRDAVILPDINNNFVFSLSVGF